MQKVSKSKSIIRPYTFGEEVGNAISHGVMALIALGGIAPTAIYLYVLVVFDVPFFYFLP